MKKLLFILLTVLLSFPMAAQIIYQCDFEDEAEREQWLLNDGPRADRCPNKWYIGEAANTTQEGAFGLFISDDGVHNTYASSTNMYAVAVRELYLPEGDYTLYFDWLAKGRAASGEGIWVCWVPADVETYTAAALRPAWVDTYRIDSIFNSSSIWRQGKLNFSSDGRAHKLAIVWTNVKSSSASIPPSGCVDNITIIPKEDECPPPTNFSRYMKGTTMIVQWEGDADWYDARVYDYEAGIWQYYDNITLKRISVNGLSEGMAQVYVRSHCGENGVSEYALYTPFYFLPGRCINYMALDDKTACLCYGTTWTSQAIIQGPIDFGYESDQSLHTLHYVPGETDPRTDNRLKTKPDGALASVRLGNWKSNYEISHIEYSYNVPEGEGSILKLNYATVLQDGGHEEEGQSSFTLEILYGTGRHLRPLPNNCGKAVFHVGFGDTQKWHQSGENIWWQDWQEVAVNLREYAGQTITVRLMIGECTYGGHWGYAYFTLDCESAELSGLNCGKDNPTTSFTAPSGFDYAWYLPDQPGTILSTEQTFTIDPMDTLSYNVDVISKSNDKCYYTLDACGIPRYPVAQADYKWNGGAKCTNAVTFYNKSYVYYKNIERWNQDHRTDTIYTNYEKVEEIKWDFGDGEVVVSNADSIIHIYPDTGGSYTPTIIAYISNGACTDSIQMPVINLPDVASEEREVHLGKGSMYKGKVYWEPYVFDDLDIIGGCEIITHVYIHETEFRVDTSFCEGGYFDLGDQRITESGTYKATLKSRRWPDVDSIVTLHLSVEPTLIVELSDTLTACGDGPALPIPMQIVQGRLDSVHILFDSIAIVAGFDSIYQFSKDDEIAIPLPDTVVPGYYPAMLRLGTPRCPAPDVPVMVQVNYPSSIVAQKNGIISLLNDSLNGGYSFSAYQWYRNGQLMEGEDHSYLIVGTADLGAQYSVVVTRSSDGVKVAVCPVIYNGAQGIDEIAAELDGPWMLVDVMGRVVIPLSESNTLSGVTAPGIYLLVCPAAHRTAKIVIR